MSHSLSIPLSINTPVINALRHGKPLSSLPPHGFLLDERGNQGNLFGVLTVLEETMRPLWFEIT